MRLSGLFILLIFIFSSNPGFAQSNNTETLTISTYYPSPYGVYRNLEVKNGLAIGDITKNTVGSMNNLQPGQLYINGSVILNALSVSPTPPWQPGQVIYYSNGNDKMLRLYNGTSWVNLTGTTIVGLMCGSSHNKTLNSKPTTNLCSTGTSSVVTGTGPWTWDCTKDGYSSPCTAYPVMCGSSDGKNLGSKPTTGLCAHGTNTTVMGTGPWTWDCVLGTYSDSCKANRCTAVAHYPAQTFTVGTVCSSRSWCGCIYVGSTCNIPESWGTTPPSCPTQSVSSVWPCAWTYYTITNIATSDGSSCPP